jgi:hypothetical protein
MEIGDFSTFRTDAESIFVDCTEIGLPIQVLARGIELDYQFSRFSYSLITTKTAAVAYTFPILFSFLEVRRYFF